MYFRTSIFLHLLKGVGAMMLLIILFTENQSFIINIGLLIGVILLLKGCPICWFMGLLNKLTDKYS